MELSIILQKKIKNEVDRILHLPGNTPNRILEMTIVIDMSLEKEQISELLPQVIKTLKMHDQVFQNVRLNIVRWESDTKIGNQVIPMAVAMTSIFLNTLEQHTEQKKLEILASNLKMFHARSRIVLLILSDPEGKKNITIQDQNMLQQALNPFLKRKIVSVFDRDGEWIIDGKYFTN